MPDQFFLTMSVVFACFSLATVLLFAVLFLTVKRQPKTKLWWMFCLPVPICTGLLSAFDYSRAYDAPHHVTPRSFILIGLVLAAAIAGLLVNVARYRQVKQALKSGAGSVNRV